MFSLISFKACGDRLEHVGEHAAFYALTWNGIVVEYFNTLTALRIGQERLECLFSSDAVDFHSPVTEVHIELGMRIVTEVGTPIECKVELELPKTHWAIAA